MHSPSSKVVGVLASFTLILGLNAVASALQWKDVAAELMSPACPGRTLANCTSGHADQWRKLIRQKIAQGETKQQIIQYFVAMRGEEILASPPKHGFALTVWLYPALIIINGSGLIIALTYRWTRKRTTRDVSNAEPIQQTTSSDPYRTRLQKELEDFSA